MATLATAEPDANERTSLLDVVRDRLKAQGKIPLGPNGLLSRMVILSRTVGTASTKEPLQREWSRLLKAAVANSASKDAPEEMDVLTGLLLVYPGCALHMIEGPNGVLMEVLRLLEADSTLSSQLSDSSKVCAATEDIPRRAYQHWTSAFVPAGTGETGDVNAEEEELVTICSDANLGLISLGTQMTEQETTSAQMSAALADHVPPQGNLLTALMSDGAPTLWEFLEIYDTAVEIDLESEAVWPVPNGLKF